MSIKKIDPRALGSITTGVLLVEGFGAVHEAITHVLGREVWTHELPSVSDEARAAVLRQFPEMPTNVERSWSETAAAILAKYGATVEVETGSTHRMVDPFTTAVEVMTSVKR